MAGKHDAADRARIAPLMKQKWDPDVLAIGTRVVYVWCASGILESRLSEAVAKVLGDAGTARSWATVLKLHGAHLGVEMIILQQIPGTA